MGWTPAPLVPMLPGPAVAPMARDRSSFAVRIITHQFPTLRCSLINSPPANSSGPVVASAGRGKDCPYPALYAVFSLPNICSDRAFNNVRAKFTAALAAVAGPGGRGGEFRYCTGSNSPTVFSLSCGQDACPVIYVARAPHPPHTVPPLHNQITVCCNRNRLPFPATLTCRRHRAPSLHRR